MAQLNESDSFRIQYVPVFIPVFIPIFVTLPSCTPTNKAVPAVSPVLNVDQEAIAATNAAPLPSAEEEGATAVVSALQVDDSRVAIVNHGLLDSEGALTKHHHALLPSCMENILFAVRPPALDSPYHLRSSSLCAEKHFELVLTSPAEEMEKEEDRAVNSITSINTTSTSCGYPTSRFGQLSHHRKRRFEESCVSSIRHSILVWGFVHCVFKLFVASVTAWVCAALSSSSSSLHRCDLGDQHSRLLLHSQSHQQQHSSCVVQQESSSYRYYPSVNSSPNWQPQPSKCCCSSWRCCPTTITTTSSTSTTTTTTSSSSSLFVAGGQRFGWSLCKSLVKQGFDKGFIIDIPAGKRLICVLDSILRSVVMRHQVVVGKSMRTSSMGACTQRFAGGYKTVACAAAGAQGAAAAA